MQTYPLNMEPDALGAMNVLSQRIADSADGRTSYILKTLIPAALHDINGSCVVLSVVAPGTEAVIERFPIKPSVELPVGPPGSVNRVVVQVERWRMSHRDSTGDQYVLDFHIGINAYNPTVQDSIKGSIKRALNMLTSEFATAIATGQPDESAGHRFVQYVAGGSYQKATPADSTEVTAPPPARTVGRTGIRVDSPLLRKFGGVR